MKMSIFKFAHMDCKNIAEQMRKKIKQPFSSHIDMTKPVEYIKTNERKYDFCGEDIISHVKQMCATMKIWNKSECNLSRRN